MDVGKLFDGSYTITLNDEVIDNMIDYSIKEYNALGVITGIDVNLMLLVNGKAQIITNVPLQDFTFEHKEELRNTEWSN